MQKGQPIAYASRALTETETNYAHIEKEQLSVLFGMEKFHLYTYGRPVKVENDHKPLEIIARKALQEAPRRLQRMFLRLQQYDYNIVYVSAIVCLWLMLCQEQWEVEFKHILKRS